MNEPERKRPRAARKAAALAGFGAFDAAGFGEAFRLFAAKARGAFAEEAEQGRLAPWLAAGFCAGVLLYFLAPNEPSWIASSLFFAACGGLTFSLRERAFA